MRWRCGQGRELRCDRRPGGIRVTPVQERAVQARRGPGHHERPERDGGVTDHERQVRDVAPQPGPVIGGGQHAIRDEHDELGSRGWLVRQEARFVEQPREPRGEGARSEHDDTVRGGGAPPVGQQARSEACQQLIALPRGDPALGGEHPEARRRDAHGEGGDEAFLAARQPLEHRDRRVDAELQGVQIAPDEGDRRVETQHHVPSLPGSGRSVARSPQPVRRVRIRARSRRR
ncbi:hypothetical protein GCM10025869_01820 [Homoserinibacter gongjuensis]|uniref:Uncharacterized protein n=1 Tax=Homoserinibacter gongjuensis TaxID=1162968 RepID=A0ABQ6JN20_9MICO|nr:hypothetical protein GCM10025869_01820 [Homoserinibacter gongjuensis]